MNGAVDDSERAAALHGGAAAADLSQAATAAPPGYRIEPFGPARWPVALQMLTRGFPQSDRGWWERGFARTRAVPSNDDQHPIGVLLHGPRGVAGVVMLYNSRRGQGAAERLHVNLSSWTVEAEARAQVLWFGRQTLALADAVYTSVTPIAASARILQRFNFTPISHQRVLAITPRLAWLRQPQPDKRRAGARVLDTAATLSALRHDPLHRVLDDHVRLGQLVNALETPAGVLPLVWRRRQRWGAAPLAELIYTPSLPLVAQHIVPLARAMLGHGCVLLECDADEDTVVDFPCTALYRRRLGRGGYPRRGIDYLYSELVYLHR